jgi:CHRD domain
VTDLNVTASGVFTYTDSTNRLDYLIKFSSPISITASHIHAALSGANGSVIHPISGPLNNITQLSNTILITLTAAEEAQLLSGGLYFNAHTTAHPGGALRGQLVATAPQVRVPIYTAARPASDMHAQPTSLPFSPTAVSGSTGVTLTGQTVNTGSNLPLDEQALVSAIELQATSPNEASSPARADNADLHYVGATSDVAATDFFTETLITFGIATYADWATPNAVEFDTYIDTNRDGEDDFVLFNYNFGSFGGDPTDTFVTVLCDLATNDCFLEEYLNGLSASTVNSVPFNTNVMLLPVLARELGLTADHATFNYQVVSFSVALQDAQEHLEVVDISPVLSYDAAHPGLDLAGGVPGAPVYTDQPGDTIPVIYDRAAFTAARSQGLVLFHHHNRSGNRVDVLPLNVHVLNLPFVAK